MDDFNPVAVRVFQKIDSHIGIFEADPAILLIQFMSCFIIGCGHGKMVFLLAQVVGFGPVLHPGEFQAETGMAVAQKNNDEVF